MQIRCQNCLLGFDAPYWQLGMRYRCPHCGQETLLARDCVLAYHGHLWSVTFLDFVQLATNSAYVDTILPLLRSFGYERVQAEPLLFRDPQGRILSAEDTHTRIQNDEPKQHDLYQTAMELWK